MVMSIVFFCLCGICIVLSFMVANSSGASKFCNPYLGVCSLAGLILFLILGTVYWPANDTSQDRRAHITDSILQASPETEKWTPPKTLSSSPTPKVVNVPTDLGGGIWQFMFNGDSDCSHHFPANLVKWKKDHPGLVVTGAFAYDSEYYGDNFASVLVFTLPIEQLKPKPEKE